MILEYGLAVLIIMFCIYMIPTGIAYYRKHNNKVAILLINLFLGWTILGWFGSLIWSVINDQKGA